MKCVNCGAAVHPAADFCRICGADAPPRATSSRIALPPGAARVSQQFAAAIDRVRDRASSMSRPSPRLALSGGPGALAVPRISRRSTVLAAGAVAGLIVMLLLVRTALASAENGGALDAARNALSGQNARIATLEAKVAADAQAHQQQQGALQAQLQTAQQQGATLKGERDSSKQQVTALDAKIKDLEETLKTQQTLTTKQQADLKTLSTCLNGTSVALAFGKTNRWSSADVALNSVKDACKAAEPLLR